MPRRGGETFVIEDIVLAILAVPVLIGLFIAGFFGIWMLGTALVYLICYGRLP